MMPAIYGNSYEIIQSPGWVAIRYEMIHETRAHSARRAPAREVRHPARYMGDARGHFEGSTLVVETTNFKRGVAVSRRDRSTSSSSSGSRRVAAKTVEWSVTARRLAHVDAPVDVRDEPDEGQRRSRSSSTGATKETTACATSSARARGGRSSGGESRRQNRRVDDRSCSWPPPFLRYATPVFSQTSGSPKPAVAKSTPAKAGYKTPKTPWGDPDLPGVYTNNDESGIPLERPSTVRRARSSTTSATQSWPRCTKERNDQAVARAPNLGVLPGSNPVHWFENFGAKNSRAWLVVDPPDGRVPPLVAEAQRRRGRRRRQQLRQRPVQHLRSTSASTTAASRAACPAR